MKSIYSVKLSLYPASAPPSQESAVLVSIPHTTLKSVADRHLKIARSETNREMQILDCMSAVVFSAFYVESALNFLVHQQLEDGDSLVRSNRWNEKAKKLTDKFPGELSPGKEPWQSVRKAFEIRNSIAHPKFEVVHGTISNPPEGPFFTQLELSETEKIVEASELFVERLFASIFGATTGAKIGSFSIIPVISKDTI